MTILRWSKAASVLLALAGGAGGVGLVAGQGPGAGPVEGPRPAEAAQANPAADPSVVEVKPGKLNFTLTERGSLAPSKVSDMLCEIEGGTTIISLKPDGTNVKAGEVVAELDSASLRDTLQNQRITTQQAEAAYQQARTVREVAETAVKEYEEGTLLQDRATLGAKSEGARDRLQKARASLDRAKLARKRLQEATSRRPGHETSSDIMAEVLIDDRLDAAELEVRASERDLEAATAQRNVLERYTAEKTTKGLRVQVEQAKADELSRQSRWELERTKIKKVERQIARCTLLAPGDGRIVHANDPGRMGGQASLQIEEGATVRERQKILSIVDLAAPMRVNAKVHEAYVDQVPVGGPVRIVVDAVPNEILTGVVKAVAPMADAGRPGDAVKLYSTLIEMDKAIPGLNLRPGMTAKVDIQIFEIDEALAVPVDSVVHLDDKDRVAVKSPDGGIELREVTLGRSNNQSVQVKQGLKPGDRVVLDPVARMQEPMKAMLRRRAAQPPSPPITRP